MDLSPTFLNTRTISETFWNNLENKTSSGTYWRVQLVCKKVQTHSSLESLMEYKIWFILNVVHHGWLTKKIFHSRLTKMAINVISFTFLSYRITWDNMRFVSCIRGLLFTRIVLKSCTKNHLKIYYVEFQIHALNDHLCFYKNHSLFYLSQQQCSLFLEASRISSVTPLRNKVSTAIKYSVMPEPLHTWLKNVFRNLLFECIWNNC